MVHLLGWDSLDLYEGDNLKVAYIIQDNSLHSSLLPQTRLLDSYISNIQVDSTANEDYWTWDNDTTGFSFKSAWNSSGVNYPENDIYKIIWNNTISPKMSICAYKAYLN